MGLEIDYLKNNFYGGVNFSDDYKYEYIFSININLNILKNIYENSNPQRGYIMISMTGYGKSEIINDEAIVTVENSTMETSIPLESTERKSRQTYILVKEDLEWKISETSFPIHCAKDSKIRQSTGSICRG